jgi:hypothetical protein
MKQILMGCPGWLQLTEDRKAFVYLPDRADVVRRIFEEASSGIGGYTIARRLNEEGVPPFGPSPKWNQSTINNLLRNRATIGEFQARRFVDGKRVPDGAPIKDFYPPVIDAAVFELAQTIRQENLSSHRGRKGVLVSNLFSGIARCAHCDSRMKLENVGVGPDDLKRSFICSKALIEGSCISDRWRYSEFEASFLAFITKLPASSIGQRQLAPYIAGLSGPDVYRSRRSLAAQLKRTIKSLKIGTGRRRRFFKIEFSDLTSWTIFPKR